MNYYHGLNFEQNVGNFFSSLEVYVNSTLDSPLGLPIFRRENVYAVMNLIIITSFVFLQTFVATGPSAEI